MPPNEILTTAREVMTEEPSSPVPSDRLEFFRAHIHPKVGGHTIPWSFAGHEYLHDIIGDQALQIALRKATQLGISTAVIGIALHDAGAKGLHVGYYLPTDNFIRSFVQARFDPLIDADDALAQLTVEGDPSEFISAAAKKRRKRADHTQLKIVGRGQVWFQGCENVNDTISIDLDGIILDEVDELDQNLAVYLDDRIMHSSYARRIALSRPSVPGMGIDAEFEASDQKHWLLRCNRCRTWTCLEESFPACLIEVRGEWRLVCARCHARLPYLSDRPGRTGVSPVTGAKRSRPSAQWVAKHPGREISGYHLSQLYGPTTTPAAVAALHQAAQTDRRKKERLTRSVLGFPFAGDRQPISAEVFDAACNPDFKLTRAVPREARAVWAGIDVGDTLHLAVGFESSVGRSASSDAVPGLQVIWLEELTDWALLERRLTEFAPRFFMIDMRPEKTQAKLLCRAFANQSSMCYFPQGVEQPIFGVEDEDISPVRTCKAPRSDVLDDLCQDIIGGAIRLPAAGPEVMQTAKRHFRKLVKDLNPRTLKYDYRRNVENHFALSLCYLRLARLMATSLGLGPPAPFEVSDVTLPGQGVPQTW